MATTLTRLWRIALVFTFLFSYLPTVQATVFTATSSGNYADANIWSGNAAPPSSLTADTVIIPTGININLNKRVYLNDTGSLLRVDGNITSNSDSIFLLTGTFKGAGSITIDRVDVSRSTWEFSGSLTCNKLYIGDVAINTNCTINVNQLLGLNTKTITINNGTLTIANNTTISAALGILQKGANGTINYPNSFDFEQRHHYGIHNANPLLYHPNVRHITIDVYDEQSGIALTQDLTIDKVLHLNSGKLVLNSHHLKFIDTAVLTKNIYGSISSDTNSSITVATQNGLDISIPFYKDKIANLLENQVKNFTINTTNKLATVHLPFGLEVHNKLNLQRGRLDINFATLEIRPTGSINGGSDSSFILTSMGGGVTQTIAPNDSLLFPVGTKKFGYTPAVLQNNVSTAHAFAIGVDSTLLSQGTQGVNVAHLFASVESSWLVTSTDTTNIDIGLTLYWTASMETHNLDRNDVFMSCYNQNQWDKQGSSTANSNGKHITLTRKQIKKLGVFAVREFSYIYVPTVNLNKLTTTLYPNPTNGDATLSLSLNEAQTLSIQLVDITGRIVYTKEAKEYSGGKHNITLQTSKLPKGNYVYRVIAGEGLLLKYGKLITY